MAKLYNLARMTSATSGTGTLTLGAAVSGYLSFADAGVSDGDIVTYAIVDGTSREIGLGTYTASGTTLARTTVLASTNGGSKISCSGSQEVFITAAAEDIKLQGAMVKKASDQTTANYSSATAIGFDTEIYDLGAWFDGGAPTRLTVPANRGIRFVQVGCNVVLSSVTADMHVAIQLFKDGSAAFDGTVWQRSEIGSTSPQLSFCSGPIPVVDSAYFEVFLSIETDTSVTVEQEYTNFWIRAVPG